MDNTQKEKLGIMVVFNDWAGHPHRRVMVGYDHARQDMSSLKLVEAPEPGIHLINLPPKALDRLWQIHATSKEVLDLTPANVAVLKGYYEHSVGPFAPCEPIAV